MTSALASFPAFAAFTPELLAALEVHLVRTSVPDGTRVIAEGDTDPASRCLFFVAEGRCLAVRARDGGEPVRFPIEAGELFGVVALVDGGPRSASVVADGPVELLRLPSAELQAIRDRDDALAFALELAIARQLARDFAAMNEELAEQAARPEPVGEGIGWETMTSYSGLSSMRGEVHRARTLAEITGVLATARRLGRRVSLRGGGLSFDTQSMGSDLVLSLRRFDAIHVDPDARTVTAGAGATWGAILAATARHGLVPPVMITGSEATAAGTLATNALSRFSPVLGKEGKWVRSVDVLLPDGERVRASRTEHADLFRAVVNGFGLVGIVLGVTHELLEVGTPIRVRSTLERVPEPGGLASRLRLTEDRTAGAETAFALVTVKDRAIRSVVTRSRYVRDEPLRTLLPHRKASVARLPLELAIHNVAGAGQRFWNFAYDRLIDETRPYVDELEGYTFLMDGNLRVHQTAGRLGIPFHTVQQTFVIPGAGERDLLAPFIERVRDMLEEERLEAALLDVLHLPEDEPFALSSTRGLAGHAFTVTLEGIHDVPTLGRARGRLVELTQEVRRIGGRVHLTKNVFATRDDLEAMYGDGIQMLARIKARYDPGGLLATDFSDRLFPALGR